MPDIEIHIDFAPGLKRVGTLHAPAHDGHDSGVMADSIPGA